ncbi:MAG: site-2 protease family protein [Chloroflexi bacterium]|nr:site-2 protease family protein [Chloroflexota bacterium]
MDFYVSLGITLVIAITVHEFSHAFVADQLGDDLPRRQGRVTLNPLAHLDPMGSLLFIVSGFGWGRPVLTNPYNFRRRSGPSGDNPIIAGILNSGDPVRTGMALVAAAGPFSNFVMALVAAIPIKLGLVNVISFSGNSIIPSLSYFLLIFISVNIGLMLFNLIPIAPLDGFKVALGLLPDQWADALARLEQVGPILLLLLIVGGRFGFDFLGVLIGPARDTLMRLIVG